MVGIKKLIAGITAFAMLTISCNIIAFATEIPTATIGDTVCNGAVLTGNYTYTGTAPQGKSLFRWYVSDNLFDKGTLIEGADKQTLEADNSTNGKFLTFAVVPVDADGEQGEEVCASPVMHNKGYYSAFKEGMSADITSTVTADGSVAIVNDPTDAEKKVLSVVKKYDSSFKTEARINFEEINAKNSVVDVYLYVSEVQGVAKLFGVYSDTYGSVIELQTDGDGRLYYRAQGELKESSLSFPENEWTHVVVEINGENKTVKAYVNGESIFSGEKKWRFENESYNNVATSFVNYGNGGSVYIKNLAVMEIVSKDAALEDAIYLESQLPSEVTASFQLPSVSKNGNNIYWKSAMPQYITDNGQVIRPANGEGNKDVTMTAYIVSGSVIVKKDIVVTVIEAPLPPIAENVAVSQNGSRYIAAYYDYYDENFDAEKGSILRWYVEEADGYKVIEDENGMVFTPTEEYDGKNIKFSVTPCNSTGSFGIETFSEPIKYQYFETRVPIVEITEKNITVEGAFEFKCKYTSPDHIEEGATVIKWYKSESLFGDYAVMDGVTEKVYTPADKSAYYKFSITPVDAEGNVGEEVLVGPFMYVDPSINQLKAAEGALLEVALPESVYTNLELPLVTENGVYYTWISQNGEVIDNNGKITRPTADAKNTSVKLTAYAMCGFELVSSEYVVVVNKYTTAPVITDQELYQDGRPIKIRYTYTDADGNSAGNIKYEWYYKENETGDFVLIEDAITDMYAPAKEMNGYIFIAKITPADDSFTVGETVTTPEYRYVYKTPVKPSVEMRTTILTGLTLTGDYIYINQDGIPEGVSEYKWYTSNKLFGDYKLVPGANEKVLPYDKSYNGKYVKFVVIPKDVEGVRGDEYEATPVLISFEAAETFDEDFDMSKIDKSKLSGGTVSIADDPAGVEGNTVLRLNRTSTQEGELSMIKYVLPNYTGASYYIIEADLYNAIAVNNTWEMFYINGENYLYKVVEKKDGKLWSRGGKNTSDAQIGYYKKNEWQHIKVVLDMEKQMVLECSLGGEVRETDMPFRGAHNRVIEIATFIQNGITGNAYIDNLQVTPIYPDGESSLAEEDAQAIDLNVDLNEVVSNLKLPLIGKINGSVITWTSSDESVITSKGKVNRPATTDSDKKVTLTAHVVKGNDYYAREFDINVMRMLTEKDVVEYDIEKLLGEYDGILTDKDIILKDKGKYGSTYKWESSDESIISNTGEVTRYGQKQVATFDVTVSYGEYSKVAKVVINVVPTMEKNLIVNGGIVTSSSKVQHHSVNAGDGDYSTYWSSLSADSAPFVNLDMGKIREVNQLFIADEFKSISSVSVLWSTDKEVWIPVNIISDFSSDVINIVEFEKVSARFIRVMFNGDGEICTNELRLMYKQADSEKVATSIENIEIPVEGLIEEDFNVNTSLSDGTDVVWTSSNTKAIRFVGNTAVVTRGKENVAVTLTATVASGKESAFKSFVVVVAGTGAPSGGSSGGGGGGGSGSGNTKVESLGNISAIGTEESVVIPVTAPVVFKDISNVSWAKDAITKLSSIGVITGTSATTFEPMRNVTREEFAAMLYRGFGFEKVSVKGEFDDVKATDWYYEPVMQLCSMGIINGTGDGNFATGKTITRQDMAVMIFRAASTAEISFNVSEDEFSDSDSISDYAKKAVNALYGSGIINGVGNNCFNPLGEATRAETAVILSRIMDYNEKGGTEYEK